ncbi:SDR family NAD(P)-dependent oxidoreductase [Actinoplanes sp. NPDC051343]|jgi:3-oxoacyl-[acyl-carrier protein] reductase|uniref:SDR family NAD(P)-dependent oxidoreductase n=1 Tax=Actinoplanes sp. NPDC051343 TaxID=3363906 RepID=UPI00379660B0
MTSRAILVTGSSRGLGRAIATRFAASGDRVAVHHRDSASHAESLVASLPGEGHVVVQADMADATGVRRMVDEAAAGLGGLDVLVNNAGIYGPVDRPHPVFGLDYEQWQEMWRQTLDVNLFGSANATWAAAQHMRERGGRIINVTSRGAFRGEPDQPAYGASKAAMNSMGQSLAVALAPYGIAVAAVAPGYIETDMTNEHLKSERGDAIRAQSPYNRVAQPDEIAAAVHWLASPEAQWASGTIIDLNGASYLRT